VIDSDLQRLQAVQDEFYEDVELHTHLAFDAASVYARDLTDHLRHETALGRDEALLELGAGAGRFSLHLAPHCAHLVALDTSRALLDALGAQVGSDARIERAHASVFDLRAWRRARTFDVVCGFFILHHVPQHADLFELIHEALRPGGRIAFIEPNRINPSFLLQVAISPEMKWEAEKGMFSFSARETMRRLRSAGFERVRVRRFGLCPPQLLDRAPRILPLQHALERVPGVRRFLPFSLIVGERR
jgi:SAM-dependent methyltransferase